MAWSAGQIAQVASSGASIAEPIIGAAMMGVQHKWAGEAARDQQNFEQFMANTTYRRAVRDMRLAGLNPVLAVDRGGAPVPSVGQEQIPQGRPGFSARNVRDSLMANENWKLLKAAREKMEADADTAVSEAAAAKYLPEKAYHAAGAEGERWSTLRESVGAIRAQADASSAQAERTRTDTRLLESEIPSAKALEELYTKYPWLRQVGAALKDTRR